MRPKTHSKHEKTNYTFKFYNKSREISSIRFKLLEVVGTKVLYIKNTNTQILQNKLFNLENDLSSFLVSLSKKLTKYLFYLHDVCLKCITWYMRISGTPLKITSKLDNYINLNFVKILKQYQQ